MTTVRRLPTPDHALAATLEASVRQARLTRLRAIYAEALDASDEADGRVIMGNRVTYAYALAKLATFKQAARELVGLLSE